MWNTYHCVSDTLLLAFLLPGQHNRVCLWSFCMKQSFLADKKGSSLKVTFRPCKLDWFCFMWLFSYEICNQTMLLDVSRNAPRQSVILLHCTNMCLCFLLKFPKYYLCINGFCLDCSSSGFLKKDVSLEVQNCIIWSYLQLLFHKMT